MSRFAHEHPDDPEGAWDAIVDRADLDRKAARENAPSLVGEIFDTVRAATRVMYPGARIPETPMPKWTPGPWRCGWDYREIGEVGNVVAYTRGPEHICRGIRPFDDEHFLQPDHATMGRVYAETVLIAAAPELYAALKELAEEIETDGGVDTSAWPSLDAAKAALAKARGEL